MAKNEMVLQFEVALNIQKRGLTTSLHEKRNLFPNQLILIEVIFFQNFVTRNAKCAKGREKNRFWN